MLKNAERIKVVPLRLGFLLESNELELNGIRNLFLGSTLNGKKAYL